MDVRVKGQTVWQQWNSRTHITEQNCVLFLFSYISLTLYFPLRLTDTHTHTLIFHLVLDPVTLKLNQTNRKGRTGTRRTENPAESEKLGCRQSRATTWKTLKNSSEKPLICKEPLFETTVLTGFHCARNKDVAHFRNNIPLHANAHLQQPL